MLLFHAPNKTAAQGMKRLAESAASHSRNVVLLTDGSFLEGADIDVLNLHEVSTGFYFPVFELFFQNMLNNFKILFLIFFNKYYGSNVDVIRRKKWTSLFYFRKKVIKFFFKKLNPTVVFVYGDRHDGFEPAIIQVANEIGIPVIIPPLAYPSGPEGLIKYRTSSEKNIIAHDVTNYTEFKERFPGQWRNGGSFGQDISFYPPWLAVARNECNVLPINPWSLGGGHSDVVCVDSRHQMDRFLKNGISKDKIVLTGAVEHDDVYSSFLQRNKCRHKISKEYFLSDSKIIIAALPQLFEHQLVSEVEHWRIQILVCEALQKLGWNVLISLHPKMDRDIYSEKIGQYRFPILNHDLSTVLSVADMFLVGQGSSTIPWGLLCEIPMVIMDWYGLDFQRYDWIEGKVVVKKEWELSDVLLELSNNEKLRLLMQQQHRKQKYLASPFDGKCVDRILNLEKTLM